MNLRTIKFLANHPLSSQNKPKSFYRFFSWQLRSRLIGKPVVYNFVNNSRLKVYPGMTGATGNIYAGLHEFYDMSFVLHALRAEDTFIDVGANVGSYTVLASSAVGATSVSIEPVPSTFSHLIENVELNELQRRVSCFNVGLGKEDGELRFSAGEDTMNHVVSASEVCEDYISVEIKRLDDVIETYVPTVVKIDVEGWETNVIAGAQNLLKQKAPLAILMEFGLGDRYGFDDKKLYRHILESGFQTVSYDPFQRKLELSQLSDSTGGNVLFVNNLQSFQNRVKSAPVFEALDVKI